MSVYEYSLITISNHENIYQEFKEGLERQKGVDYELIKINNNQHQFSSARTAYNEAATKANGKYFVLGMFVSAIIFAIIYYLC